MSPNVRKLIHRIYAVALILSLLIAGVCLMAACYGIYSAGLIAESTQIFTPAIVAEAFSVIAVPVYICLALVIGSFLLHMALPLPANKPKVEKNRQLILSRLEAKTDLAACDANLQADVAKEISVRKRMTGISAAVLTVCSLVFLVYALIPGRWPEISAVTGAVKEAALVLLACLVLPTVLAIFTAYYNRHSMDKQIELMKQASAQVPKKAEPVQTTGVCPCKYLPKLRFVLLIVAILAIVIGYSQEGFIDVIAKAAAICTECVGLG